jgi:2-keto-4-pentenoate hydratase/2-oxohepta-3-ene-1,7-dioic acid hydratase in catechol pathway
MKLARYLHDGHIRYGLVEEETIHELLLTPFSGMERQGRSYGLNDVELLPPSYPQKIIAVGLNYRDHAEEVGMPIPTEPMLFMKPPSSLIPHGGSIIYPAMSERVDYEAELAVVVKTQCIRVPTREAPAHILGYTCANDVTARDLQIKDGQWTRAKGFDTFCPLGPFIETDVDLDELVVELRLNGETRQSSAVSNLIFSPAELVSFVSHIMTLYPGDVIITGTPSGIGELQVGDVVEVSIEGVGLLRNSVTSP